MSNVIGVKHVKKDHGEVYEEGLIVPNTSLLGLTWGRKRLLHRDLVEALRSK